MLSFGSAAYLADKTLVGTFSANLETLPGAAGHPRTLAWWKTQPAAWAACRQNLRQPEEAMKEYVGWLKALPGVPVFVGYPVVFDYMFIQWYLIRFAGESPFSFVGLDIKTLAWAMLNINFRDTVKTVMPKHWFDDLPHTHEALDDAKEQGALFCNMLAEHLKR
jgi:DNA polymerase III alpha subunit (gram-positive type)